MTLETLIAQLRAQRAAAETRGAAARSELDAILARARAENRENLTPEEQARTAELFTARDTARAEMTQAEERITQAEREQQEDAAALAAQQRSTPAANPPAYDRQARVGQEERTYAPHKELGYRSDGTFAVKPGGDFLRDVGRLHLGDFGARERLERHMREEAVERAGQPISRAVGTAGFAGLVVPQYLTDLFAPAVAAGRPFANAINQLPLPAEGMTVTLSRITTSSSTDLQAAENDAVAEQNMDDTLLTVSIQTNAGQQTLSRQAVERGTGIDGVTVEDLFRRYGTKLDSTLLNQATNGLTNVATAVAYTDASPTTAELYPKFLEALSGVEGALLDQDPSDNIAVMHSRRWYWLQNGMVSTWPLVSQPGIAAQMGATNLATAYGSGVRGVLPNGTPVIVDNNIGTTLGAGTEDEAYVLNRRECFLWEDPNAPMLIRTEDAKAANLGVLFVVYGYFAYTHVRYAHARKIAGTGMIAPTFAGV